MERQEPRTQIHYRINEICRDYVKGTCGARNYEIHQRGKEAVWFFQDRPEETHTTESVHRALFEVVQEVMLEVEHGECYCGTCEELRASPLRFFHAGIIFQTGLCTDYVFLTTGASEESFRKAVRRAAKRAEAKAESVYEAAARFLRYMHKQGFVNTAQHALGEIDLVMVKGDNRPVCIKVKVPK